MLLKLGKRDDISEEFGQKFDNLAEDLDKTISNLTKFEFSNLNKKLNDSELEIARVNKQLEYGGKSFQIIEYNSKCSNYMYVYN